ncbi:MAG: AAA family ATPase, partial [Saprospiraceae bacterium]|nr:AAA family ATPase [Saprospiraceae bacterium]
MALTSDFRSCLSFFEYTDESYFVTGKAGTGKSTLLQLFKDTTRKRVAVVAPTGIAALNVRGQTIHSFFGLPPYPLRKSQIHVVKNKNMNQR